MNITRNQSYVLGIGTLALFFILSVMMLKGATITKHKDSDSHSSGYVTEAGKPIELSDQRPTDPAAISPLTLDKFHRSEIRDGKKLWEVSADKGKYFPQTQSAELENATLFLYRKDDSSVQLKTTKASLVFNAAALLSAEVKGDVVLTYGDKVVIKTDFAIYDRQHEKVTAPGHVIIENENVRVEGDQLDADLDSKEFTLKKDVSSIIQPRKPS